MSPSRAFTLIELLVVIAIIAILAAILFPVFAQAKEAAKKSVDLSNQKQLATAVQLYLADSDDVYPLAQPVGYPGNYLIPTPFDAFPEYDVRADAMKTAWGNSILPYIKNFDIFRHGADLVKTDRDVTGSGVNYTNARKAYATTAYHYNGLLSQYSATAVNQPSKLRLFTCTAGNFSIKGYTVADPYLDCTNGTSPCVYRPVSECATFYAANGCASNVSPWQWMVYGNQPSMWVFSKGMNAAMADTSARFFRMGASVNSDTDYRTDFRTNYDSQGKARAQWKDAWGRHPLLFRPDFDFATWETPTRM